MDEDDYGVDERMDDEDDNEFDDENSQVQGSDYEDTPSNKDEDQDKDGDIDDDKDRDQDDQDDQLESAEDNNQENRYEVIQEDQIVYDKPNIDRITSPFMTKYEKARIIGVRAVQISKNSPLYLTADSNSLMNWDPLTIAEKELSQKKIPFIIRRYLPDGSFEDWKISQLKTFD